MATRKTTGNGSFGYYLNNARFRLFHSKRIQSGTDDWGSEYERLKDPRGAEMDIEEEWQKHIEVFEEELREFKVRLRAADRRS
jgi:hypothetical protein